MRWLQKTSGTASAVELFLSSRHHPRGSEQRFFGRTVVLGFLFCLGTMSLSPVPPHGLNTQQ